MKVSWIITSAVSALIAAMITFFLTGSWKVALLCAVLVFVIVLIHNPNTRYMRYAYMALFPLLCNIYFTIHSKTENFDIEAGLREIDITTTFILGGIAIVCLFLDYLERSGKLNGTLLEINKNSNKKISGSNININQTINKNNSCKND